MVILMDCRFYALNTYVIHKYLIWWKQSNIDMRDSNITKVLAMSLRPKPSTKLSPEVSNIIFRSKQPHSSETWAIHWATFRNCVHSEAGLKSTYLALQNETLSDLRSIFGIDQRMENTLSIHKWSQSQISPQSAEMETYSIRYRRKNSQFCLGTSGNMWIRRAIPQARCCPLCLFG